MENKELKRRLSNIRDFPTLSMVATNVIKLIQNPENKIFTFNHSAIGALLLKKRSLPFSLVKVLPILDKKSLN